MSILKGDEDGIKEHSEAMNCGELYGLFSCMVSGRAWSSITEQKLESGVVNPNEVSMHRIIILLPLNMYFTMCVYHVIYYIISILFTVYLFIMFLPRY